jgi:hypothetical protein
VRHRTQLKRRTTRMTNLLAAMHKEKLQRTSSIGGEISRSRRAQPSTRSRQSSRFATYRATNRARNSTPFSPCNASPRQATEGILGHNNQNARIHFIAETDGIRPSFVRSRRSRKGGWTHLSFAFLLPENLCYGVDVPRVRTRKLLARICTPGDFFRRARHRCFALWQSGPVIGCRDLAAIS